MNLLVENEVFTPTKKTVINESNITTELPKTVFDYITLENGETLLKVEGIVGDYKNINGNKRLYSEAVWDMVLSSKSNIMKDINENNAWGVREHPADGTTKMPEISHRILSIRKDTSTNKIMAEVLIVNTSAGKDLRALFESGGTCGISSRGYGDVVSRGEYDEVLPGYSCETFDFVTVNSVKEARFNIKTNAQKKVSESETIPENRFEEDKKMNVDQGDSKISTRRAVNNNEDLHNFTVGESMKFNESDVALKLSQLKSIVESNSFDSEDYITVNKQVEESIKELNSVEGLAENRLDHYIKKFDEILARSEQNLPSNKELKNLRESSSTTEKKYEALKQISEGVLERYKSLKEDYKSISSRKTKNGYAAKIMKENRVLRQMMEELTLQSVDRIKTESSKSNALSKKVKALTSISEELLGRIVSASSATPRKSKVNQVKESICARVQKSNPALVESVRSALRTPGITEKIATLIGRCKTVSQVNKIVSRVEEAVNSDKSIVLESRSHEAPLPTKKSLTQKIVAKNSLHESASLVALARQLRYKN